MEEREPKQGTHTTVVVCALCTGQGKTFGIRKALTCVECGGSGLLKFVDGQMRRVPLERSRSFNWHEFDYNGESRSRSLRRNGVKLRSTPEGEVDSVVEELLEELDTDED